jgi:hypothetical protein
MHKPLAFSMRKRRGAAPSSYTVTFPDASPADHRWLTANHTRGVYCLSIGMLAAEQAVQISSGRDSSGSVTAPWPRRLRDFLLAPVAVPVVAYCVSSNRDAER